MHLKGFPHTYAKDGKTRQVCYTIEARELRAAGWVRQEEAEPELEIETEVEAGAPEAELEPEASSEAQEVDLESLTRRELLQYAMDRGVDLPDNTLKAELVERCKAL